MNFSPILEQGTSSDIISLSSRSHLEIEFARTLLELEYWLYSDKSEDPIFAIKSNSSYSEETCLGTFLPDFVTIHYNQNVTQSKNHYQNYFLKELKFFARWGSSTLISQ